MGLGYQETLGTPQIAAGTVFDTYTTAKTVINPQALVVVPAGFFIIGKTIRITAQGNVKNIVTTPGLVNFQVKIGSAVAFDTANIQLNATAHAVLPFKFVVKLTCRSVGNATGATVIGLAEVTGRQFTLTAGQVDDAQGMQTILAPNVAMAVGAGFDSTIANIIDFWAGFTISNSGNGVQIHEYFVEALN